VRFAKDSGEVLLEFDHDPRRPEKESLVIRIGGVPLFGDPSHVYAPEEEEKLEAAAFEFLFDPVAVGMWDALREMGLTEGTSDALTCLWWAGQFWGGEGRQQRNAAEKE